MLPLPIACYCFIAVTNEVVSTQMDDRKEQIEQEIEDVLMEIRKLSIALVALRPKPMSKGALVRAERLQQQLAALLKEADDLRTLH